MLETPILGELFVTLTVILWPIVRDNDLGYSLFRQYAFGETYDSFSCGLSTWDFPDDGKFGVIITY